MDDDKVKKKYQTKEEAALSFGKPKEEAPTKEKSYTYVEKVYTFKDGSCRVIEPKYTDPND